MNGRRQIKPQTFRKEKTPMAHHGGYKTM